MNLLAEYNDGEGIPDSNPEEACNKRATSERIRLYTLIVVRTRYNPEITCKHVNLKLDDGQLWATS